jgi:hypothetical protein
MSPPPLPFALLAFLLTLHWAVGALIVRSYLRLRAGVEKLQRVPAPSAGVHRQIRANLWVNAPLGLVCAFAWAEEVPVTGGCRCAGVAHVALPRTPDTALHVAVDVACAWLLCEVVLGRLHWASHRRHLLPGEGVLVSALNTLQRTLGAAHVLHHSVCAGDPRVAMYGDGLECSVWAFGGGGALGVTTS